MCRLNHQRLQSVRLKSSRIQALEDQHLMPRITRETIIALAEERAVAMGLTIEYLRAKNKGYAGLKTLDEQSAALRSQLP